VHKPGSNRNIRLQRGRVMRVVADTTETPIEPRGVSLRPGLAGPVPQPYFVHHEEVSSAGAIVARSYQRVRWIDGPIYVWRGREEAAWKGVGIQRPRERSCRSRSVNRARASWTETLWCSIKSTPVRLLGSNTPRPRIHENRSSGVRRHRRCETLFVRRDTLHEELHVV
jgi:hypothetical protein